MVVRWPWLTRAYDIGFSNSVIEHVGSWERQQQFASEMRRVAKSLWVQTPAYECPIEPHYMTPLVHYLPLSLQKLIIRWCTVRGWIDRPTSRTDQSRGGHHAPAAQVGDAPVVSRLPDSHRAHVLDHSKILHRHTAKAGRPVKSLIPGSNRKRQKDA